MDTETMRKRLWIDGELVTEEEVKANFPKKTKLKDLYTIELHYKEPISKEHYYNGKSGIRAVRTLKETLVTADLESVIDILTDWMDVPKEEEVLNKPYDEIPSEYKAMWASREKFEENWERSKQRADILKTAREVLRNGEVEPGRYLTLDMDDLFSPGNHDRVVVAHDLGACDKKGDPLTVYEKEVLFPEEEN